MLPWERARARQSAKPLQKGPTISEWLSRRAPSAVVIPPRAPTQTRESADLANTLRKIRARYEPRIDAATTPDQIMHVMRLQAKALDRALAKAQKSMDLVELAEPAPPLPVTPGVTQVGGYVGTFDRGSIDSAKVPAGSGKVVAVPVGTDVAGVSTTFRGVDYLPDGFVIASDDGEYGEGMEMVRAVLEAMGSSLSFDLYVIN